MKRQNVNELNELIRWITNTNQMLGTTPTVFVAINEASRVINLIDNISAAISDVYPFYSKELPAAGRNMFSHNGYGVITLNPAAFGEVFIIIRHLDIEPVDMMIWKDVHPRIVVISGSLFNDGYYSSAAEKAMKEVETRLREKFAEFKPDAGMPTKIGEIIGALLSENGAFEFCSDMSPSGKNYRRGIQQLLEGAMTAYRNLSAHANLDVDRRSAMEQIVLASQLMYVLDSK